MWTVRNCFLGFNRPQVLRIISTPVGRNERVKSQLSPTVGVHVVVLYGPDLGHAVSLGDARRAGRVVDEALRDRLRDVRHGRRRPRSPLGSRHDGGASGCNTVIR